MSVTISGRARGSNSKGRHPNTFQKALQGLPENLRFSPPQQRGVRYSEELMSGRAYLTGARLQLQGKLDEALSAFHSASGHLQLTLGPDHPDTGNARQIAK
jgi:hypothetical protein